MKKALIVILSLILLLGGLFFWKGGHHALYLANVLEEYLDSDNADQSMILQVMTPGARVNDSGNFEPHIWQYQLCADTFWTEYGDRPVFGLTAQGVSAYCDGRNLYMDTGAAYALPDLSGLRQEAGKLALGLLLHGRVTKQDGSYQIAMKTDELEFHASLTAEPVLKAMTVSAILPNDTAVNLTLTAKPTISHPIPREITDAMVRARMEPPMPLTEPLEILLPAMEGLFPLTGELTLGVECGILELGETVILRMDTQKAELERKGVIVSIDLPGELSGVDPAMLGLLLLRSGTLTRDGSGAKFDVTLSPEATGALCDALVPQASELGISFQESHAVVTIESGTLTAVSLTAAGEVPFLVSTIPLSFHADLKIH